MSNQPQKWMSKYRPKYDRGNCKKQPKILSSSSIRLEKVHDFKRPRYKNPYVFTINFIAILLYLPIKSSFVLRFGIPYRIVHLIDLTRFRCVTLWENGNLRTNDYCCAVRIPSRYIEKNIPTDSGRLILPIGDTLTCTIELRATWSCISVDFL